MTVPIPAFLRRHARAVLLGGFALLLIFQAALHVPMIKADAPYEGWDEVTTYNGARVLAGPTAGWIYRYGTLDSLLQFIGLHWFLAFDPIGAGYRHIAYSNNDPASLDDEFYVFDRLQPDELGYAYFRGIDDHRPIALSRWLHFAVFYGLVAAAGLLWIWLLGAEAAWLLLPMLCLTVTAETYDEAVLSLPNAINAALCFAVVAAIGLAQLLRRGGLLRLAAGLLAVALNFKIDVLPLGAVLSLALLLQECSLRARLRQAAICAGIFLAVLVATDPLLLSDPAVPLKWLLPPVNATSHAGPSVARFLDNLGILAEGLKHDLLPGPAQTRMRARMVPILLLLGMAAIVFLAWRHRPLRRPLVLAGLAVPLLWIVPLVLAQEYYARYELNGVAALYAMAGLAVLAFRRQGGPMARRFALALAVLMLGQYGALAAEDAARAAWVDHIDRMVLWGEGNAGWSQEESRNIAEWHAVDAYHLAGGYDRTILVDQHAYLDLRPLRLAGLDPVFVDMDTLDRVLAGLDPAKPHLLLYSPGSYDTDPAWWRSWMSRWPPETERRYDAYRAALAAFPVLFDTGGPAQHLLWTGPVDRLDRMVLAAVPARSP